MMRQPVKVNQPSIYVKQLSDENRKIEIVSCNNNIAEKFNIYFAKNGNTYGDKFPDSYAIEDYSNSANIISQPLRLSTVSLESLETIIGSLKISSPVHGQNPISNLKEFLNLLESVVL